MTRMGGAIVATITLLSLVFLCITIGTTARLADRGRVVSYRKERTEATRRMNSRVQGTYTKPLRKEMPIEGPKYRGKNRWEAEDSSNRRATDSLRRSNKKEGANETPDDFARKLGSQLTGCCTTYTEYTSDNLCYKYGENCATGQVSSHDSEDEDCSQSGLSFIGVSFSVNTGKGNPYSYQLCDQFAMENIIDRAYDYVMSMDEDGWLVGGGYKSFDYSGKMPYIDSSHTELIRIGSLDVDYGGTTIEQVYAAMASITFPPIKMFPEKVKGGGKGGSGDCDDEDEVPSGDVTLGVSVVEDYGDDDSYSIYEQFLDNIFNAMDAVNGGACMDDHDTDPHVSMSRGVKFHSSYHETQYFYKANLEVAVWQNMYPGGVVIGSSGKANFPPEKAGSNREYIGYGNLYFFFDRSNITKAFHSYREMTSSENYYSTLYSDNDVSSFYSSTTSIDFDYGGSGSGGTSYYEHNPYIWNAKMAKHDMTDGWNLPPNCQQEGETFLGIPLSQSSSSKLQTTSSFQNQFDFELLVDRNFTYMQEFGTNHGWLNGEIIGNGPGSIVDKDTTHIPLFYTGTTNPNMGGIALSDVISIVKAIDFGALYIKPAFLFQDEDGAVKIQFEADSSSAMAYLYNNLCMALGLSWNYENPSNEYGKYTNCAMHAAGDRATYGCGPDDAKTGGYCPQMTLAYDVDFQSEDHAAAFISRGNTYVDYWRSIYPSGVAVGTDKFCPDGGCLGLYLNRYDLYQVFRPDLGGSWIEYNGGTFAPTVSPAPSAEGGCDNPHNRHLDKCFRKTHKRRGTTVAWESLGKIGQLSVFLVSFMAVTLSLSIFLARARKNRKRGESYMGFLVRDVTTGKKRRKKKKMRKKKRRKMKNKDLGKDMLSTAPPSDAAEGSYMPPPVHPSSKRARSKSKSRRSRSKSRPKDRPKDSDEKSVARSKRSSSSKRRSRGSEKNEEGGEKHRSSSRRRSSSRASGRRRSRSRSSRGDGSVSQRSSRSHSKSRREKEENVAEVDEDEKVRRQLV